MYDRFAKPNTIWKYQFDIDDKFALEMPAGAKILSIQMQGDTPTLWAAVHSDAPKVRREFVLFGTGHSIPDGIRDIVHLGTFQMKAGALVFHVFEDRSESGIEP